jgi:hypothetical protein
LVAFKKELGEVNKLTKKGESEDSPEVKEKKK